MYVDPGNNPPPTCLSQTSNDKKKKGDVLHHHQASPPFAPADPGARGNLEACRCSKYCLRRVSTDFDRHVPIPHVPNRKEQKALAYSPSEWAALRHQTWVWEVVGDGGGPPESERERKRLGPPQSHNSGQNVAYAGGKKTHTKNPQPRRSKVQCGDEKRLLFAIFASLPVDTMH